MLIIILQQVNYNSYLDNLVLQTLSIFIPHYLLMNKVQSLFQVEHDVQVARILTFAFIVTLLHMGHYLKQKDLATVVIRKHMLEQSQVQLQTYF